MFNAHHARHTHDEGHCGRQHGGRVRSFIQPSLLLLLAQKPAHGYELMERLGRDEDAGADPGLLYRTLRQFEEDGLVCSSWDTEGRGPARRVYEITEDGLDYLHAWAVDVRRTQARLERFLADYESHFQIEKER